MQGSRVRFSEGPLFNMRCLPPKDQSILNVACLYVQYGTIITFHFEHVNSRGLNYVETRLEPPEPLLFALAAATASA
jgi:hypothetical protein